MVSLTISTTPSGVVRRTATPGRVVCFLPFCPPCPFLRAPLSNLVQMGRRQRLQATGTINSRLIAKSEEAVLLIPVEDVIQGRGERRRGLRLARRIRGGEGPPE